MWRRDSGMNSYGDLSDMALKNVLALADGEDPEEPDPGEDDNGGGMANKCCPIWNVTIEIGGDLIFPKIICSTGGSYKCVDCTC